jgi:hypothetical protein
MNWKGYVAVGAFIVLLSLAFCRPAKSAEVDLRPGLSFGPGGTGPVLGLQIYFPIGNRVDIYTGTDIFGHTSVAGTNWDWHAGFRTCRAMFCASVGASYIQTIDRVNGAHTNYNLGLSWLIDWKRIASADYDHWSDLGTTPINKGRNVGFIAVRLQ